MKPTSDSQDGKRRHGVGTKYKRKSNKGGFFSLLGLPETRFKREALDALAREMFDLQTAGTSLLPAGYTYFGQFIDHDITRLSTGGPPGEDQLPTFLLEQQRSPSLDLDSVYGAGLADESVPSNEATGELDLGMVREPIRGAILPEDLPRSDTGKAHIGDSRNDENLIVAQLHVAFIKLHNWFVRRLRREDPHQKPHQAYEEAQHLTVLVYQYLIVHDFLQKIVHPHVWKARIGEPHAWNALDQDWCFSGQWDCGVIWSLVKGEQPRIPLEFAGAAYRFGHSLVRGSYTINDQRGEVSLAELFQLTGRGPLVNHQIPYDAIIDWRRFFPLSRGRLLQKAQILDTELAPELQVLEPIKKNGRPRLGSLAQLNLRRGNELGLPSGQDAARLVRKLTKKTCVRPLVLQGEDVLKHRYFQRRDRQRVVMEHYGLHCKTPLWFYLLFENELDTERKEGSTLGVLGSWLVLDTLLGLIHVSKHSLSDRGAQTHIEKARELLGMGDAEQLDMAAVLKRVSPARRPSI